MERYLVGRLASGEAVAVATSEPFFCVAAPDERLARAAAERAHSFWAVSRRPRPAPTGAVAKPDFVRAARLEV